MRNKDFFMVSAKLQTHPKFRAYVNALPFIRFEKFHVARSCLFGYLFMGESCGWDLSGMSASDIAKACGWTKDPHSFVSALLVAKIIRKVGDDYHPIETRGIFTQSSSPSHQPLMSPSSPSHRLNEKEAQTRTDASNSAEQQPLEADHLGAQTRLDSDKTKKESSLSPSKIQGTRSAGEEESRSKDAEEETRDVKPCTGWYGKRAQDCMGFRGKIPEGGGHYFAACSSCMSLFSPGGSAAPQVEVHDETMHPRVKALFREAAKPKLVETEDERESRIEESRKRTMEVIAARGITQEDMDEARLKTPRSREA